MSGKNLDQAAIDKWIADLLLAEDFSIAYIPLANSLEWCFRAGAVRHRSGRFFSVVGVRAIQQDGGLIEQPLLEQREIGTLALIVRRSAGLVEILVQAKAEPGNIGTFQLAPSFQATASNAAQAHGGQLPPMAEWFAGAKRGTLVADSLQSEQGTRFLGKRNRNCTLLIDQELVHGPHHAWMPARALCALLGADHLLNTDLRSTLLCSDWDLLASGEPFSGPDFARDLLSSYRLADTDAWEQSDQLLTVLQSPARWRIAPEVAPLSQLHGWRLTDEGIEAKAGRPFCLRHIQVRSLSREITAWDQPIVQSAGTGEVWLPVGYWNDAPHFLFRIVAEPGFGARMELTPAITIEPGVHADPDGFATSLMKSGRVLISCLQSEEGGRFLFDQNNYVIVDIGHVSKPPDFCHWLSLAQIRQFLLRGESFTNEARSALSLLLKWL